MDAYEYALMKETLERIQNLAFAWRENDIRGVDTSFDAMYEIETLLDECGFDD